MGEAGRLLVLYGSQTFTAQEMAERIWRTTKVLGFRGPVQAMDDYPITRLIHEEFAIFVCATCGQGEEPDNMKKFFKFLLRKSLPANSLTKLKFGVLGLGDSSYAKFNFAGKKLHKRLLQLGATPLLDIGLCDYQHDLGHDAVMIPWMKEFFAKMKSYYPFMEIGDLKTQFVPRWKVSVNKNVENYIKNTHSSKGLSEDIYYSKEAEKSLGEVKLLEIEKNQRITDESHFQDVRLISLKVTDGLPLSYKPGDVFNVRPRNFKEDVEDLFQIFETHGLDIKPCYHLLVEELHEGILFCMNTFTGLPEF